MAADDGFHLERGRRLEEETDAADLVVLVVVCIVILALIAIGCFCRKRRGTQKVEF
jgi:hypothetical protein